MDNVTLDVGALDRLARRGLVEVDANGRGEEIRLGDLLGRTAVVLAFYRGSW